VLFAGWAGEHGKRPGTATPAPGQAKKATAENAARKVLLRDGQLPGGPALTERMQHGHDDVDEHGFGAERRERTVENAVRARLVVARERFFQRSGRLGIACGRGDLRAVGLLERCPSRLGSRRFGSAASARTDAPRREGARV